MDSIVGKQIIGILILFLLVIPTHGCIILPIPTPGHGGYDVITQESIASLEPEKATRADVLLKIGDPAERLHQDRFFVYFPYAFSSHWQGFLQNSPADLSSEKQEIS